MMRARAVRATALTYVAPGRAELRPLDLPAIAAGMVEVETRFSAISRGTERLVFAGRIPPSEYERMRAPFQAGAFPFPVAYGYAAVGVVRAGPAALIGREVFTLSPHQTLARLPADAVVPLPEGLDLRRAPLAANLETALNVAWDAGIGPGDRIAVVGGGVLGLMVAAIAAAIPATEVTVVDIQPDRAKPARALGARFALPAAAPDDQDCVIHASASEAGLATALELAGIEATVVEASWFGAVVPQVPLGAAFHSRRLTLKSSQVGEVPPARRVRWTRRRRLETALALLRDPKFDMLISGEVAFADLPARLPDLLGPDPAGLATIVRYG
jgi:NADPH:quinone reductase-like Zn-dependent oxidoreductase